MLKVGVIGVGSIGKHHARIFSDLQSVELVGVVDINSGRAEEIASIYSCKPYVNYMEIMNSVDAVSIAVPTNLHHQTAMDSLRFNKDILLDYE